MSPSILDNQLTGVMVAFTGAAMLAAPSAQARKVDAVRTKHGSIIGNYQYLLKHEGTPPNPIGQETLVEMPVTRTVKLRFEKPNPLEFQSIEDTNGFAQ